MNKAKKTDHKKTFVRNTEQTLPKTVVGERKAQLEKQTETCKKVECIKASVEFGNPEPNFTRQLAHKIKTLESLKPRKTKSTSDIGKKQKQQLFTDEKISKKMNFPYCQPIYKDLISLCVKMQSQPMIASREPLPLKDKEPVLSEFLKPKTVSEYSYQVSTSVPNRTFIRQHDGLKLYRVIQNWS